MSLEIAITPLSRRALGILPRILGCEDDGIVGVPADLDRSPGRDRRHLSPIGDDHRQAVAPRQGDLVSDAVAVEARRADRAGEAVLRRRRVGAEAEELGPHHQRDPRAFGERGAGADEAAEAVAEPRPAERPAALDDGVEEHRIADEIGDETVDRARVELAWRSALLDPPAIDDGDAV